MEMLENVTVDMSDTVAMLQNQQKQMGSRPRAPRKFQLPQLNLHLNQSMQFDAPSLVNQSQSVLHSQHIKQIPQTRT